MLANVRSSLPYSTIVGPDIAGLYEFTAEIQGESDVQEDGEKQRRELPYSHGCGNV